MEPKDIVYDICRHYINDQHDVDAALKAKIDGFRRSRNLAALASCTLHFDWTLYSIKEWRFLRQVEAFFKKNSIFSTREECSTAAERSFMDAERMCNETNLRLEYFYAKRDLLHHDLRLSIERMERYISDVLGPFHSFMTSIPDLVKVTPGATESSSRRNSLPQLKLKMKLHATRGASPYIRALYRYHGFNVPRIKQVTSNRVELVPKNWKTDRTIACEPEGNLPFQLAFDTYAKRRLRRFRINLSAQSANQRLAQHASIHDDFVTVDFTAASDTISYNAVAWLFPPDWFRYLDDVRSPSYRGCFGEGDYFKFSSMGNGSTFTIETLVFAAACYAVGSRKFLVYGDDVIIEKEYYCDFVRLTRFLGFVVNAEKSFSQGPFRESCGFDAYDGVDVTPVYIRTVDRRLTAISHLINTLGSLTFPGSNLGGYLLELYKLFKPPLVPFNESTTSGVWIEPGIARTHGILRRVYYNKAGHVSRKRKRGFFCSSIDEYKALAPKGRVRQFVDSRGYYLWFLRANDQVLFAGPWDLARYAKTYPTPPETSSVTLFQHGYVRKWVVWQKPHLAVADHLYWWSDLVLSVPLGPGRL